MPAMISAHATPSSSACQRQRALSTQYNAIHSYIRECRPSRHGGGVHAPCAPTSAPRSHPRSQRSTAAARTRRKHSAGITSPCACARAPLCGSACPPQHGPRDPTAACRAAPCTPRERGPTRAGRGATHLEAQLLQAQPRGVRPPARRDEHHLATPPLWAATHTLRRGAPWPPRTSAFSVTEGPPFAGSTVTATPVSLTFVAVTFVLSKNSKPCAEPPRAPHQSGHCPPPPPPHPHIHTCFFRMRENAVPISLSIVGTILSMNSTTVTYTSGGEGWMPAETGVCMRALSESGWGEQRPHLRPQTPPHRPELQPDDAATDNNHRLWNRLHAARALPGVNAAAATRARLQCECACGVHDAPRRVVDRRRRQRSHL